MAIVTVYNFKVRNSQRGTYEVAKAKCPRETIAAMGLYGRIIEGTGEEVDASLLTESKRYYRSTASPVALAQWGPLVAAQSNPGVARSA